ncbi:protein I'm not dead yet-like isoform X1 [Cydia pomonella]|uniref:protein I'm not dead yet-like isoform X2 n=1 Tax=Cydia pomonella TaxID=82600 RepID=UPI002ADD94AC|nr:protein I'm not dead yet-like isoform X2 [Cydia pomonella]XP_061728100.1 protein I'm not dead yet-like isoform X1 [Cydia pomonella]
MRIGRPIPRAFLAQSSFRRFFRRPAIDPESPVPVSKKFKLFFCTHYRGVVAFVVPFIFISILAPFPPEKYQWCAYTLGVMAVYWVFECIPLAVTSFIPLIVFPLTDIMSTRITCLAFVNDSVMMFLGSIMLASAVEQSGLHKRMALYAIKVIGYSHYKMLFAVASVTMFISMWITNTAAVTMMVPIVFALLKVYESQKLFKMYNVNDKTGEKTATPLTSCYFCCITYAATNGGIGTLVGTATNLVFKGLFATAYPTAPEYISFPLFSVFAIPLMIVINMFMYFYLVICYMGLFRPNSAAAKSVKISADGLTTAKKRVESDIKDLGPMSCHEIMVLCLFCLAILLFFSRSPQVFPGWADRIREGYGIDNAKFIRDSAAATFVIFLMLVFPSTSTMFQNYKVKFVDELPKGRIPSCLNWDVMNASLPYSFAFLLAGGFALSTAAGKQYSDLNGKIGEGLQKLEGLPNPAILFIIIIFTIFVTNFASNVAVCNVITPIAMQLAANVNVNPLWYNIATGIAASFAFMIPVGTPGNLIVQSAANIPTSHMIIAGIGPTITTLFFTWLFTYFYAPVIWPIMNESKPEWLA